MALPTPHFEKLTATLDNDKLPAGDVVRLEAAIVRYHQWIEDLSAVNGTPEEVVQKSVAIVNEYLDYINLDLIFDSSDDFLYRQKGQLKLDNSVIEEFLPWLIRPSVMPELTNGLSVGPMKCYSSVYFESTLAHPMTGAGIHIRTKDQDFAISRRLYLRASYSPDFSNTTTTDTYIAYVVTEIKTNLDKTMFQEASATARDLKMAVPGAIYFLMAEWLDMTPLSTTQTDIEEVLLIRGAKRMNSNERRHFSIGSSRRERRDFYADYLTSRPLRTDVFQRWVNHIRSLFSDQMPEETGVLEKGYF